MLTSYPSIVCALTAVLTPFKTYINYSSGTISLNANNLVAPTDVGTTIFTITVTSSTYPSTVTQSTKTFNVIVTCTVSSVTFSVSPPASATVKIGIDA